MVQRTHGALVTRARRGDARSQFDLGMLYLQGVEGLKRNDVVALDWLLRAARQDHPGALRSMIAAGSIDAVKASPNRGELTDLYRASAEQGDPLARWSYLRLVRDRKPADEAVLDSGQQQHMDALANDGHRAAQWALSRHEYQRQRRFKARYWAERAAERGSTEALTWLSSSAVGGEQDAVLEQMSERFIARLLRQQHALSPDSQALLFLFWRSGQGEAALRLAALERAASSGHGQAQFERGLSLLDVAQVLRNRVRREDGDALQRIVDAAALPLHDVDSLSRAVIWFEAAARAESAEASYLLGIIYRITAFAQRSLERSDQHFAHAAALGQVDAQCWLGNKLWREREHDAAQAIVGLGWLARAAHSGNTSAASLLAEHSEVVSDHKQGPFALFSDRGIEQLQRAEPLLAARIGLGRAFDLTRLEALQIDPLAAYTEAFLVVDLSHATPRHRRRVVQITCNEQRLWLAHAVMQFRSASQMPGAGEGDYRSRVYRCEKALLQDCKHAQVGVA